MIAPVLSSKTKGKTHRKGKPMKPAERPPRGSMSLDGWAKACGIEPMNDFDSLAEVTPAEGRELLEAIHEAREAERRAGLRP
jgi:hypothetical protein